MDLIAQHGHVRAELQLAVEAAARIVQVHLVLRVQPRIVAGAQFVQGVSARIAWVSLAEPRLGLL